MKNIKYLFIFSLIVSCSAATPRGSVLPKGVQQQKSPGNQFLISDLPKVPKKSKRALKEDIGDSLPDVLQACAKLQNSLGALQIKLSSIQSQLLASGRNLIENRGPMKKATKKELHAGLQALQQAERTLHAQVATVARVSDSLHASLILAPSLRSNPRMSRVICPPSIRPSSLCYNEHSGRTGTLYRET